MGIPNGTNTVIIFIAAGWILSIAAVLSIVYWMLAHVMITLAKRSMPPLRTGLEYRPPGSTDGDDKGWPAVSVIVPAHNEEQFIGGFLDAVLGSKYPADKLEVIVAADRGTDRTVEIVRKRAEGNERLKLTEITECPPGWSGKCHASWRGGRIASERSELLIFTDADTIFHPDLIRAAVGLTLEKQLDFLTLLGSLTRGRDFEKSAQPAAAMSLMKMYPIHRANRQDKEKRRAFANGQFMLFRRAVYEEIGTHEFIRSALLEDLRFARRLNAFNKRMGLALARDLFEVRMYETWAEFVRGWKRIFTEAANRNIPRLRSMSMRLRCLAIAPVMHLATLALGLWWWNENRNLALVMIVSAGLALVIEMTALMRAYRMQGAGVFSVWRYPLGCWKVAGIVGEAVRDLRSSKGTEWAAMKYEVQEAVEK